MIGQGSCFVCFFVKIIIVMLLWSKRAFVMHFSWLLHSPSILLSNAIYSHENMCSKFCIAPVDLLMLISCMFKLYLFYNNNEISYHVYKYTSTHFIYHASWHLCLHLFRGKLEYPKETHLSDLVTTSNQLWIWIRESIFYVNIIIINTEQNKWYDLNIII